MAAQLERPRAGAGPRGRGAPLRRCARSSRRPRPSTDSRPSKGRAASSRGSGRSPRSRPRAARSRAGTATRRTGCASSGTPRPAPRRRSAAQRRRLPAAVGVDDLRRQAAADGYEGVVGRRLLETLASQTGFYMARELLAKKDHRRARVALSVATEAAPTRPIHWYNLGVRRPASGRAAKRWTRSSAQSLLGSRIGPGWRPTGPGFAARGRAFPGALR